MKQKSNLKLFVIFETVYAFKPHFLVAVLFYQQILGSYLAAMSVFSTTLITVTCMELPMGIVSDFIGRRKTMLLGAFCYLTALIVFSCSAILPETGGILCFAGAFLFGLNQALFSGTHEALLYESCKACALEQDYKKYYSRGKGFAAFSSAVSAVISGILAYFTSYVYCFMLSAAVAVILLAVCLFWRDVCEAAPEKNLRAVIRHIKAAISLFKSNTRLGLLALARVLGDNVSYRIDAVYFKMLIPEYLLGAPRMLKKLFEYISYLMAERMINRLGPLKTLIFSNYGMIGIRAVSLIVNNFLSPFITAMVDLFDGTSATGSSMLLQKEFSDQQRATMASIVNMASTVWTALLLTLSGFIMDNTSVRTTLAVMLVLRFARIFVYYRVEKLNILKS